MAAVGSDLTAIGHIAGHKNATTTALYVHNSETAARRAVALRAEILGTDLDTGAGQAAEMHPLVRPKFSESFGGPSWTRTRSQWIKNAAPANSKRSSSNDSEGDIGSREAPKRPETTLFGHGVQHENRAKPMSDVHWAAAGLLHRVADGEEITIEVLRDFAELVLCSELVVGARAVLDGPPEFAVRRALELASVVLARGVNIYLEEEGKGTE